MPVDEIVDIGRADIRRRRQLLRRLGVPLLGVALVILSILGIALYSYRADRAAALVLSRAVLDGLQARIAREVDGYLSPATQAALIARDMVARRAIPDDRTAIEGFAASMLNQVPHLEGFYAASGDGNFIMVRRDPRGGTDTKLILNLPGSRQVSSTHLDASGRIVDTTPEPGDDFDPRQRVWYQGALKTDGIYWTAPYVFYTTRAPGITAAIRFTQAGSADQVFGVDITLEALSGFLDSLPIGRTGRAAIVDAAGDVIAAPNLVHQAPAAGLPTVGGRAGAGALNDPALSRAYDRFRIDGYGSRTLVIGGKRYVTIARRLPAAGQDWVLLIAARESDFTALAENNSRQHLLLSLITMVLAVLLGLLLVRQNRRVERTARLLSVSRETGARETRALSALAAQPGLFDPGREVPALTESLAELSAARRASIWRLTGGGRVLRCEDAFDAHGGETRQGGHLEGLELARSELPGFFDVLDQGETIEVADAAADRRTASLHRLLMRPFGSHALSMLPVQGAQGVSGAVLLEDAAEAGRARNFAQAVSSIVALRIGSREQTEETAGEAEAADAGYDGGSGVPPHVPAAEGTQAFSALLTPARPRPDDGDPAGLAATWFPEVAAMIIRFDDAITLGRPDQAGVTAIADEIATAMQAIATRYALPYMKLTGHHLVAAAGCVPDPDPTAAARLADAALAAREACLSLLSRSGYEPVFHIGLDVGTALGCVLGESPRLFNLWGDVVRNAEMMAHSASGGGAIQVSESAYTRLRQDFLFRTRGTFYLPRIGPARTFILAGRR